VHVLIDNTSDAKVPASSPARQGRHRWHAVTIAAPANACAAALACKGRRFLSSEAPKLPLSGCDGGQCTCKYRHFDDRRAEGRRQADKVAAPAARQQSNRRTTRGRRSSD
jgi:hypothetical protein